GRLTAHRGGDQARQPRRSGIHTCIRNIPQGNKVTLPQEFEPGADGSVVTAAISRLMPTARLSDAAFASRHRALRLVLWLHLPLLIVINVVNNGATFVTSHDMPDMSGHDEPSHAWLTWTMIALVLL